MGKPLFKSAKQIAVDAQALKLAVQRGDRISSDKSTVGYEDDDSAYINTVLPDVVVTPKYKDYDDYNRTIAARDKRALEQQQREMNNYVRAGMNKAGEVVAGAMMMLPPVAAADPIAAGVGRVLRLAVPRLRAAARASRVATNNTTNTTPEVIRFYHGSPVRFDAFSADFIGSGEGGSKVMKGINLWPEERIANAPKFANINSPDAPLHLGVPSKPLGGELNPTVYDVSGRGLNLYTATPREVKGLSQSDLISRGYDGIRTPSQVTVFPESIGKLSIDKQSTIEEFVRAHPEVERWTPWTTDAQKMQDIISASRTPEWTPEQWTAAQDAAIARGDMAEAQRLRDLHFQVSAPNTQIKDIQYHGSKGNAKFNVFDPNLIGQTDKGWAGRGYYFTPSEDYAKMYGLEPRAFYINAQKVHDGTAATYFGRENSPAANAFKIIRKRHNNDGQQILDELASSDAIRTSFPQTQPYNGTFEEVVTRNNNQMKLADAVTYDDNGVRIPLGKRDNFNMNDIRYALPFVLPSSKLSVDDADDTQLNN